MAEVYDFVDGVPGNTIARKLPNGNIRHNKANQLERVIALHEDVQRRLIKEGMAIHQRARFRMTAAQQRHRFKLREDMADALETGDPDIIATATRRLERYERENTDVIWSQADIDFHVMLHRQDGREFYVEADTDGVEGDRGLEILQQSLTR